jgi:Uma2 family endonuclease
MNEARLRAVALRAAAGDAAAFAELRQAAEPVVRDYVAQKIREPALVPGLTEIVFDVARRLGRVFTGEPGFRLTTDPDTVRAPDVAFVRQERVPAMGLPKGYWPGAPDLAVEVISPTDLYTEVDEKVATWLEHGTRLVFVVNPRRRTVAVHRPGRLVRMLGEGDVLNGEDIVPGWALAVGDLFR